MSNQSWTLEDSFETWMNKYNQFIELTGTEINFRYLELLTVGRVVKFGAGQIRNGSQVEDISGVTLTLTPSSNTVVGVYKAKNEDGTTMPSVIAAYILGSVPNDFFVPIYAFTTNATKVLTVKDMRTPFSYGTGGGGGTDGPIMLFDQHITKNLTIPTLKNGLSVGPIVDEGVTVTVSDGSEWAIV
jgi:hypothetical protein